MPLRRWQFEGGKNRGGYTSVRGRVRSPHILGGRRWLSCRQPACLQPRQLRHKTDGRIAVSFNAPLPHGEGTIVGRGIRTSLRRSSSDHNTDAARSLLRSCAGAGAAAIDGQTDRRTNGRKDGHSTVIQTLHHHSG